MVVMMILTIFNYNQN